MNHLDLHTILEYYAILCLCCMPISIPLLVVLYRKTGILQKVDARIDKWLGNVKPTPQNAQGNDAEHGDGPKAQEKEPMTEEEIMEKSGISCFAVCIGDNYFCRKNSQMYNGNHRLHELGWITDNFFVGKADDKGFFQSNHAGVVNVFCYQKDDPMANTMQCYSITVLPTDPDWFPGRIAGHVVAKTAKTEILRLALKSKWKIVSETPAKGLIVFERVQHCRRLTLQFDSQERLERAAVLLGDPSGKAIADIGKELAERFERVRLTKDTQQVWIHRVIDESKDEVDAYAYLAWNRNGTVLGFSQAWREYGDVEEFVLNVGMAPRLLADCIGFTPSEPPVALEKDAVASYYEEDNGGQERTASARSETEAKPEPESDTEPEDPRPGDEGGEPEPEGPEPETEEGETTPDGSGLEAGGIDPADIPDIADPDGPDGDGGKESNDGGDDFFDPNAGEEFFEEGQYDFD